MKWECPAYAILFKAKIQEEGKKEKQRWGPIDHHLLFPNKKLNKLTKLRRFPKKITM